jgi:hypothetical protein
MALTGGATSEAVVRYELLWIVLAILDVLDGRAQYVVPEAPGLSGVDAVRGSILRSRPGTAAEAGCLLGLGLIN